VDALVNSYIRIPEDEKTIENFGETPYYIMARKEDQDLIDQLDYAIDCMNVETPNWRTDLYNQYYGSEENNRKLTEEEQVLLKELQTSNEPIRTVMNPDNNPYAWYENGVHHGIAMDIFKATAEKLHLDYEIIPASSKKEYEEIIASGKADIWMDMNGCYEDENKNKYKITDPYLTTIMSVLRIRSASKKISKLVTDDDHITVKEIISQIWPTAKLTVVDSLAECKQKVLNGEADGALLMSYTAQKLARDDVQNRLRVDIVPSATLELMMGVNANDNCHFYGLWEKTLTEVANNSSAEIVQKYLEQTATPTFSEYMFDHPIYLIVFSSGVILLLLMVLCIFNP
jgi:ABC-type amino acid transport substrate-binding protein